MVGRKLIQVLIVLSFISCHRVNQKEEPLGQVGDIIYDPEIDSNDFQPCHEDLIYQYYNFGNGIQYEGEKAQIIREFKDKYVPIDLEEDGFVTIRFIVNCKGKTVRFRLKCLDNNYVEKIFNSKITDQLMKITRSLNGWKPGDFDGEKYDYIQHLTFKIKAGHIESIIP